MRQQPPPPTPQPLRDRAFLGRRPASGGFLLKPPSLQSFLPLAPLGVSRRNALGRWPASGGLLLKAPSPQPSRPSAPFAFQRMPLRAVLGLRPRRCSRVGCPKPLAGSGVRASDPFALALTDAPCPAARSHAALPWLGLSPCALPTGLLLLAAPRMPAVAVPNFPMARNTRWARAGVSGTSPALTHRWLALTAAPCFFVTLAVAFFSRYALGADRAASAGAPVPSEFRACGAPVPTLRRSPLLRRRAVVSFFLGWRPER